MLYLLADAINCFLLFALDDDDGDNKNFNVKFCAEIVGAFLSLLFSLHDATAMRMRNAVRGAIHQFLNIILKLRILVLLPVSTMPYVVMVKNYS
jgi:hypothetical protein